MRQTYTTTFAIVTAAVLILACVLFAIAQHGHPPPPSSEASVGTLRSAAPACQHLSIPAP